jgi:hypothetical protein
MKYTAEQLKQILDDHKKWLTSDGGSRAKLSRADLSGADLFGAKLSRADLSCANLSGAKLSRADLFCANLSGADLSRADLSCANLSRADLSCADLSCANLSGADLSGADLFGAKLSRADLSCANLSGADLSGADLFGAKNSEQVESLTMILPDGDLIGWKKCNNKVIVKVQIPADAKRSNSTGRKCRAEYVKVLEVIGAGVGISHHDNKTEYKVGEIVRCDSWNENRWEECAGGIHFFITRWEAENY